MKTNNLPAIQNVLRQRANTHFAVADPGEAPPPPLFLDQTETRKAEKKFGDCPPPPLSQGLDDYPPLLSEGLDPRLL